MVGHEVRSRPANGKCRGYVSGRRRTCASHNATRRGLARTGIGRLSLIGVVVVDRVRNAGLIESKLPAKTASARNYWETAAKSWRTKSVQVARYSAADEGRHPDSTTTVRGRRSCRLWHIGWDLVDGDLQSELGACNDRS